MQNTNTVALGQSIVNLALAANNDLSSSGELPVVMAQPRMTPEQLREEISKLASLSLDPVGLEMALGELKERSKIPVKTLRSQYDGEKKKTPILEVKAQKNALEITDEERVLAKAVGGSRNLFADFNKSIAALGYPVSQYFTDAILCAITSRHLDHGTGWAFTGPSSSGKSDIPRTGFVMLPAEQTTSITSSSQKALYYMGDVVGQLLVFGEIKNRSGDDKDDEAQEAMRQLISEGKLTRILPEKQPDGSMAMSTKVTEGPASIVFSTTAEPDTFCDELVNRCFWIPADTSKATNEKALAAIAKRAALDGISIEDERVRAEHRAKWEAFFKCQEPCRVQIPFAEKIKPEADFPAIKRVFKQLLDLIRLSAMLHQQNRKTVVNEQGDKVVIATKEDYERAYEIADKCCPRPDGSEKIGSRESFQELSKKHPPGFASFTLKDAMDLLGLPRTTTQTRLSDMKKLGWLSVAGTGRAKQYTLSQKIEESTVGLKRPETIDWS